MNTDLTQLHIKNIPCPMILIKGSTFDMGSILQKRESPIHSVTIPDFYIAQYPVTQALYQAITGKNPSYFKGSQRPVEKISWQDAHVFIKSLNKETNRNFELPSEAQWEFAARGGIHSQGYTYCGSDELKQVGWYHANSGGETKPVGLLLPNELGLYDMSGNVWEWCEDDWHKDYKQPGRPDDGKPWKDGNAAESRGAIRVIRGGGYFDFPFRCRPAFRFHYRPVNRSSIFGLRLVLSLQAGSPSAFL